MDTTVWGPPFWFTLHTICLNFPENPTYIERQQHLLFFESLKTILPCSICRNHYKKFLQEQPISPYLDNKNSLKRWVLDCHNNVNKLNNKKIWTMKEVDDYYDNIYNNKENFKCNFIIKDKKKKKFKYNSLSNILIIILFVIIFCLYIFKF
jgi:hypothetical protein